jgi:hypothetical protein
MALEGSARLGSPRVALGPILRDPQSNLLRWDLTLTAPALARAPEAGGEPSVPAMLGAVQRSGAAVRSIGAVRVEGTNGERRSQVVQLEPGDPAAAERVLSEVAGLPGVVVSAITWSDSGGRTALTFRVTVVVPR